MRLTANTPVGSYDGGITLTSGSTVLKVSMPNSKVRPAILTITADDKTKIAGATNPELTVSYAGFVNNETVDQLTSKPTITTVATKFSVPGNYPITVFGASSFNYSIKYVNGILIVNALPPTIVIPNIFTPNGDGANDVWAITALKDYPAAIVSVYNRYGEQLYYSPGNFKSWDGTYHGKILPTGVYYYIIQLDKTQPRIAGYVTIMR